MLEKLRDSRPRPRAGGSARFPRIALLTAVLVATLVVPLSGPAGAKLPRVGKVDPVHGYPRWYQDETGLRLGLCMEVDDPLCLADPLPDPSKPSSVETGNLPEEAFWWVAETGIDGIKVKGAPERGSALLVLAMEAAWLNEEVVDGDQVAFARIRMRLDGLEPNTEYSIVHPFGTAVLMTDEEGEAREATDLIGDDPAGVSSDIGCAAAGKNGCNFTKAAQKGGIGPFLTWDTFGLGPKKGGPPKGHIGDPAVEHAVTGSPFDTNFFEVSGPGLAQPASTDQFVVMGKIFGASRPGLAPTSDTGATVASSDTTSAAGESATTAESFVGSVTNADSLTVEGVAPAGTTVEVLVDGEAVGEAKETGGRYSVTIDDLAEGTHEITAAANDDSGPSSPLTVTVDRTAPRISAMGMEPATFDTAQQKSAALTARVSEEADVAVEVMAADGTVVRELPTGQGASGTVTAAWDGTTDSGDPAESGTYEIVLAATDMAGNVSSEGTAVELAAATSPDSGDGGSATGWIIIVVVLAVGLGAVWAMKHSIPRRTTAGAK
jgi:hypothetical protein